MLSFVEGVCSFLLRLEVQTVLGKGGVRDMAGVHARGVVDVVIYF